MDDLAFDMYWKESESTAGKPLLTYSLNQAPERVAKRHPCRNGPKITLSLQKEKKLERTVGKADPKKFA